MQRNNRFMSLSRTRSFRPHLQRSSPKSIPNNRSEEIRSPIICPWNNRVSGSRGNDFSLPVAWMTMIDFFEIQIGYLLGIHDRCSCRICGSRPMEDAEGPIKSAVLWSPMVRYGGILLRRCCWRSGLGRVYRLRRGSWNRSVGWYKSSSQSYRTSRLLSRAIS